MGVNLGGQLSQSPLLQEARIIGIGRREFEFPHQIGVGWGNLNFSIELGFGWSIGIMSLATRCDLVNLEINLGYSNFISLIVLVPLITAKLSFGRCRSAPSTFLIPSNVCFSQGDAIETLIESVGITMDATKMTFESNSFDTVIDKGTMDALLVCITSWSSEPSSEHQSDSPKGSLDSGRAFTNPTGWLLFGDLPVRLLTGR